MSADLQKRFRELAKGERVHVGGKFATQNDLSALFAVRAVALYLRAGGRIAFVLPLAALNAAREAETAAAAVPLPEGVKFQRARKLVRDGLTEAGIAPSIDALVTRLLDSA
jgi:hypothetical protein